MATVSARYIVDDVDKTITFYCKLLGFHEEMHPNAYFAMLSRGDLRLVLSRPGGGPGGGQAMPDGQSPAPGGWNWKMPHPTRPGRTYSNGRGERIRADTPSRSLLIPVTNVPTSASSDAAPRFGQHQAVARAFSRPSRIRSRPYSKSSP
jgi:hypothetical protein